jgi:hypothetical protein
LELQWNTCQCRRRHDQTFSFSNTNNLFNHIQIQILQTNSIQLQSKMSSIQTNMSFNSNPNCLRILSADTIKANGGYQWKQVYAGVVGDQSVSMLSQKGNELYSLMKTKIEKGDYEWLFNINLTRVESCTFPFAKPYGDSFGCFKYDENTHRSKVNIRYLGLTLSSDKSLCYFAPLCASWQTSYVIFETEEEDASIDYYECCLPDPIDKFFDNHPTKVSSTNLKKKWIMTDKLEVYRLFYYFIRTENYCKLQSKPFIQPE